MKKILYNISLLMFSAIPASLFSQYAAEVGGSVGVSNYLGDMGGKSNTRRDFVSDMKMAKTRYDVSFFTRYKLRREFYVKGELSYLRLAGDDAISSNPGRHYRNLNFVNNVFTLEATGEWMFYENTDMGASYRFRNAFRAHIFAGVGVLYHNPKTKDDNGDLVKLRPLMTEGQSKPYKKIVFEIPVGIGFHFTVKKRHRIGWDLNWRTTFTDYIDDVKGNYADPATLSPEAAALANRTDVVAANAFQPGFANNFGVFTNSSGEKVFNKRGDPTHNDSFLSMSVSYSYVIRGKSSFYKSRYGSFFKKRGRKVIRRIRSKF
ncbi:MAG: outer membrane beta-barrel protein [Bacteroidia bacterium]|nr:outer membrane beta-barrel protein [Bacteroidia bacterium]